MNFSQNKIFITDSIFCQTAKSNCGKFGRTLLRCGWIRGYKKTFPHILLFKLTLNPGWLAISEFLSFLQFREKNLIQASCSSHYGLGISVIERYSKKLMYISVAKITIIAGGLNKRLRLLHVGVNRSFKSKLRCELRKCTMHSFAVQKQRSGYKLLGMQLPILRSKTHKMKPFQIYLFRVQMIQILTGFPNEFFFLSRKVSVFLFLSLFYNSIFFKYIIYIAIIF